MKKKVLYTAVITAMVVASTGCQVSPQSFGDAYEGMPQSQILDVTGKSLGGKVSVVPGLTVDSDTADAISKRNDIPTQTQPDLGFVQQTAVGHGGIVGIVGKGLMPGKTEISLAGDEHDFYLLSGLSMGAPVNVAIDSGGREVRYVVALWDAEGREVKAITTLSGDGFLNVPSDGDFILEIRALEGFFKYQVAYGDELANGVSGLSLDDSIIPYRALVGGKRVSVGDVSGNDAGNLDRYDPFISSDLRDQWETVKRVSMMSIDGGYYDLDRIEKGVDMDGFYVPNDPEVNGQWGLDLVDAKKAWDYVDGSDVIVAVVDSGMVHHPDIDSNLIAGYDFVGSLINAGDGDGYDSDPFLPDDTVSFRTSHGLHTAGIIAGVRDNDTGIAGVAPGAKIMPIRVLGENGAGATHDIVQGIRFAAGLTNESGSLPPKRADIINLSLSTLNGSQEMADAVREAIEAGVIVVASLGNGGSSRQLYPASYPGVIAVSAVTQDQKRASYSNYGYFNDVAAPGGDLAGGEGKGVLSLGAEYQNGVVVPGYVERQGTSQAAPFVSGVIALMLDAAKQKGETLGPDDISLMLASGVLTQDIGAAGRDDNYGYGVINARKAVHAVFARFGDAASPVAEVNHGRLDFKTTATTQRFVVSNVGGGDLVVQSVTASAPWITVEASGVQGEYLVTVDRSIMDLGESRGIVSIQTTGGDVSVQVVASVAPDDYRGNVGPIKVTLYALKDDGSIESVVGHQILTPTADYEFLYEGLSASVRYSIRAGKDTDANTIFCEQFEPCGGYIEPADDVSSKLGIQINVSFSE